MALPDYVQAEKSKSDIDSTISEASETYGVEPELIRAIIDVESTGDSTAVSPKKAKGLMQLTSNTAKEMGVTDVMDIKQNIMGGTKYLAKQLEIHNGDIPLALASYNAGPSNVKKHKGVPPFPETKAYIKKVQGKYNELKQVETSEVNNGLPDYVTKGGLPDYVTKEIANKKQPESVDPNTEPQEWDPEWMKISPLLAGMYGAGKGLLEQAVVPTLETLGMIGGGIYGSPIVGTALGYGIAKQFSGYLVDSYKRLGGEKPKTPTISDELIESAADVGTALVMGKAVETGIKVAPIVENYLFESLPKRLYGSAIKTPMSKKWIQTLPNEVVSKQTAAIEEGLNSRVPPSEYGLSKIKGLETEVLEYIDDITKILSEDPTKVINREVLLKKGLEKAYSKAANSSNPEGAKAYVDTIAERFRAHPKNLTPEKANQIKRQLYEEVKYGGSEPSAINAQMESVGKKGIAREIMLNLEQVYPALAELNATDAARISLTEAIEKSAAREVQKSMVPLGAKILMRPKTWPLAMWDATFGHPQVKARLAFALHKADPVKYPAKPFSYVPPVTPKPEKPFMYESPEQVLVKAPRPQPLTNVESSGISEIRGVYTPDQLNKMLGSKNVSEKEMAIQDIIDTRKKVETTERDRIGAINTMLKNLRDESKGVKK